MRHHTLRLALFTETFLPKVDGVVNTLCHLLDYLAARGHRAIVFAPEGSPPEYAGMPVISLPCCPFPFYPELKLGLPFLDVSSQIDHFRPDLIHVLNPFSLGLVGMKQARRLGVPLVASYHTDIPGFLERWGFDLLVEPLWAYLLWLHGQADLNLCPSEATRAELAARHFPRLKVWSRGVDATRFHPARRSAAWRHRLSQGHPDAPLLLYVGRLSPEKRVDWLQSVLTDLPEVRLALVGDGPARPTLERLFDRSRVVFTGYLRGDDLANAYAAADIFVFPAANETFGNVVLEAMASGLPVVAARSGGPLDSVVEGETGLLFAPQDNAALRAAVRQMVHNPTLASQLGRAGRARAERLTWSGVLDRLADDYFALLQQSISRQAA
jgi:phosphatidylinositol alpha 1,6-mannosyltransferase